LNRRRDPCNPYRENQQSGAVPAEPTSPLDALAQQVRGDVQAVPRLAGSLGAGALRALNDPAATLQSATRYGQSLSRVLTPPQTSGSPLLARRGRSWRFAAIDVAFADLRATGKAAGGSVIDVYLAALLGGYRHYHAALGTPIEAIPMTIPISLRKPGEARGGNLITSARFAGPVAITDHEHASSTSVHSSATLAPSPPWTSPGHWHPWWSDCPPR
jgi:diacylglycerol O-acyltransferase